jgi:hypothetical protein
MAPELALGGLQRWLQGVIVHPGTIEEAVASREAARLVPPSRLESVVRPSATLTATQRAGIYHDMYLRRMAEALESDYPALAHFLGEERWRRLVSDYVASHPSTTYTLNALGQRLPDWLRARGDVPSRGFCRDLARLEWAVAESFDAEEAPRLGAGAIESLPPGEWPCVRLVPSPALRLVALDWNADAWLDTAKDDDHAHPRPRRGAAFVTVFRQSYAVYRRRVGRPAFALLSDLAGGATVGRAVARALRRAEAPSADGLGRWFREWAADGLFTAVERQAAENAGRRRMRGVGRRFNG